MTFNAIKMLKKNVLTFRLFKSQENVVFPLGNHLFRLFSTVGEILRKKVSILRQFVKKYFFEYNRNSIGSLDS